MGKGREKYQIAPRDTMTAKNKNILMNMSSATDSKMLMYGCEFADLWTVSVLNHMG